MKLLTTIDFADTYISKKLHPNSWVDLDEQTREALLYEASILIYAIQGFKFTPELIALLAEIPNDLQQACCEVAFALSKEGEENPHIINQNLGIKSISFG